MLRKGLEEQQRIKTPSKETKEIFLPSKVQRIEVESMMVTILHNAAMTIVLVLLILLLVGKTSGKPRRKVIMKIPMVTRKVLLAQEMMQT